MTEFYTEEELKMILDAQPDSKRLGLYGAINMWQQYVGGQGGDWTLEKAADLRKQLKSIKGLVIKKIGPPRSD